MDYQDRPICSPRAEKPKEKDRCRERERERERETRKIVLAKPRLGGGQQCQQARWRRKASGDSQKIIYAPAKRAGEPYTGAEREREKEKERERQRTAAIKKSRVSIQNTRSGRGDFSKYKFRVSRYAHHLPVGVSYAARDAAQTTPALRCRPFFLSFNFFLFSSFFFHIINSLRWTAAGLCALFDPSCHPRRPRRCPTPPRNALPRLHTEPRVQFKRWSWIHSADPTLAIRNRRRDSASVLQSSFERG